MWMLNIYLKVYFGVGMFGIDKNVIFVGRGVEGEGEGKL